MYGPPCHQCGSDMDWLPGRDGENCECGWPDNKSFPIKDETPIELWNLIVQEAKRVINKNK